MKNFLIVAAAALATTLPCAANEKENPGIVRMSLAGARVDDNKEFTRYDARQHYYLIATGDCDGASLDLILTPDPSLIYEGGLDERGEKVERFALPHLRDGKGVNIGDTPDQVRRKIGVAAQGIDVDSSHGQITWNYYAMVNLPKLKGGRRNYHARYFFRKDRLFAIWYNTTALEGEP